MTHHAKLWAQLDTTFEQDTPITTQLLDLLQREREALEQRDYDTFQKIIGQKKQLISELELHSLVRQQLLNAAGFTDESNTLDTVDVQAPTVANAWRHLGEQWKRCQELNDINERIAQRTRLVVSQVLDLLRGQTNQPKLYTSKGNAQASGGGRTITSA